MPSIPMAPMVSPMQGLADGLKTGLLLAQQAKENRMKEQAYALRALEYQQEERKIKLQQQQSATKQAMDFGIDLIGKGMAISDPHLRSRWFRNQAAVAKADSKFGFLEPYLSGMAMADEDRQKEVMKELKALQNDLKEITSGDTFGSASAAINAQTRIADAISRGLIDKEIGKQMVEQLSPFFNYQTAEGQDIAAAAQQRGLPPQAAAGGLLAARGLQQTPQGGIERIPEYMGAVNVDGRMVQPSKAGGQPRDLGPAGTKASDMASVTLVNPQTREVRVMQYRKGTEPQIPAGWVTEGMFKDQTPAGMSETEENRFVENMFYSEMVGEGFTDEDYPVTEMMKRYKELKGRMGMYDAAQEVVKEFKRRTPRTPPPKPSPKKPGAAGAGDRLGQLRSIWK